MAQASPDHQQAIGTGIAQVIGSGTAVVNIYQQARPQPVKPKELAAARRQLAALPLDTPAGVAPLPPGSRLPFRPNPLFVGREADLQRLAQLLKGSVTAAI